MALRREILHDYVQDQGKLTSQVMKERQAENDWEQYWGFFKQHRNFLEEEALKKGMSAKEYWQTIQMIEAKPLRKHQTPSRFEYKANLPKTSNGMVGWFNDYNLEFKNSPTITPVYHFKKQNVIFLG